MAKKWTLLAYKELSADATTLDTADGVIQGTGSYFSKSQALHVVMWGSGASGGATDAILRFGDETNGIDSGSSYKWVRFRGNTSGAPSKENQSSATTSFYNSIFVAGNSGIDTWHFIEFDIDNTETQYKGVNSRTMRTNDSSLANALQTQWTSGEWSKTDRQCQRIQLTGSGGDSEYASGTGIAVYGYIDDIVSDEKDTLADKIAEVAPVSITSATGWDTTNAGSNLSIDSNGKITQGNMTANGRLTYDLGSNLQETWTIDYDFQRTSSSGGNVRPMAVATNTGSINDSGVDNNAVGQYGDTNFNAFKKEGTNADAAQGWIAGTTDMRYMRLSRTSATNLRIEVFTNSDRTTYDTSSCGSGCSGNSGIINQTISLTGGLRYLVSGNGDATDSHTGTIENIKVYDGAIAGTTAPLPPTANTRYEETDTRKMYRWNDNKDITNGLKALYEWSNSGDVSNTATGSDSIGSVGNLGATNSASYSTSVKKIGTASGHFPNDSSYSKTSTSNGANFDFTGDSTVTLWVRRIDGLDSDYHAMVSKRSGSSSEYNLYLSPVSSGVSKAYVYITAGGSTTNVATDSGIPDSTWTHLAVTISGSVLKFYINGSLDATRDVTSGSKGTISQPFGLGAISGSGTEGFQGYLDQVSIWDRALTAGEVSKIYNGGDGVADLNALTDKGWVERGTA